MMYFSAWRGLFRFWRADLVAGIAVSVVALPLALGFAITTGAPASSGLVTAIVAGFVAALFGGSNFQVSGPTGAMTVVLVPIVAKHGIESLIVIGLIAGGLIILMALLGLGKNIDRVPLAVMEGFTLGIAVIIALQQIPLIFEIDKAAGTHAILVAYDTLRSAMAQPLNWTSISVVALALIIKGIWPHVKKLMGIKIHIPASILAIIVITFVAQLLDLKISRINEIPKNIFQFHYFSLPNISLASLLYAAVAVAFLGAIESLLSARVADALYHRQQIREDGSRSRETVAAHDPKQELIGQGLGTIASALAGGMPATGAIARTSVNVNAGARTRFAAISHALVLLFIVFVASPLIAIVPTAALAGVLLGTSLRIANPRSVAEALRSTVQVRIVYFATAISVVAIDLVWGVLIGILLDRSINLVKSARERRAL
jgi:SulP family sulfate permease